MLNFKRKCAVCVINIAADIGLKENQIFMKDKTIIFGTGIQRSC